MRLNLEELSESKLQRSRQLGDRQNPLFSSEY